MPEENTPEQKAQLSSWAGQRDSILLDLANKRVEQEKLATANREMAASHTRMIDEINQGLGRLKELNEREKEYEGILSVEVSKLETEKSRLNSEVVSLQQEIDFLLTEKDGLIDSISKLSSAQNKLSESATETTKMIGLATEVNTDNVREIENLLITLKEQFRQIVAINTGNIEKTNAVILELPKMIFELQRDILERKKFNKIKHT